MRWHLCCHLPAPPRLRLLSCRQSSGLGLPRLVFSGYQGHWFFSVLSLTSISLLCYSLLVFWHSQRQVQILVLLVMSWRPGVRDMPKPQNLLCWGRILQVNIYKVIHVEHSTENMLDVRSLALLSITSHSTDCLPRLSCVLSPCTPENCKCCGEGEGNLACVN